MNSWQIFFEKQISFPSIEIISTLYSIKVPPTFLSSSTSKRMQNGHSMHVHAAVLIDMMLATAAAAATRDWKVGPFEDKSLQTSIALSGKQQIQE
jgi:hypothetical protein